MTKETPNYITPKGFQALREEYQNLLEVERPKLVETVAWAASNGDRSENGDYIYGKRRLREIDRRLRFLAQRLEKTQVIDPTTLNSKSIVFGATVTVETEEGETKSYQIVGEDETDAAHGKISWKSPMAKALLGKRLDQEVEISRPSGSTFVTIISIAFV